MVKCRVMMGSVTDFPTDAIITGIYPGSPWTRGVDGAIRHVAGSLFHSQASAAEPLYDGEVVVARSKPWEAQKLKLNFRNVVFVVDAGQRPLSRIVYTGLKAAADVGFRDVTLPAIRLGVMLGAVEKTAREIVDQLIFGIQRFNSYQCKELDTITFVIYNNEEFHTLLSERFILE